MMGTATTPARPAFPPFTHDSAILPEFIPNSEARIVRRRKARTDSMPRHLEPTRARRPQAAEMLIAPPKAYLRSPNVS